MKFELEKYHRNTSNEELVNDLVRVSRLLKKDAVTIDEYNKYGIYNASTLSRRFGSWFKALDKAGLQKTRTLGVSDEEYLRNIEQVWIRLGRQPRYDDMERPLSKYCASAYAHRFGSWRKALGCFVEFVNGEQPSYEKANSIKKHRTRRSISWRLRFIVMRDDGFKCRICGRNPAANPEVTLHVDHIIPWSKGGETVLENLQTLCSICNIGKSDLADSIEGQ